MILFRMFVILIHGLLGMKKSLLLKRANGFRSGRDCALFVVTSYSEFLYSLSSARA